MSLYDGLELEAEKDAPEKGDILGWSSGIKLLHSQLQLKKAVQTQNKRDPFKKGTVLPPVLDLKGRKEEPDEATSPPTTTSQNRENRTPNVQSSPFLPVDPDWNIKDEYDPMWPNDYEKIIKEQRERKEKERREERRRDYEERRRRSNDGHRDREDLDRDRDRRRRGDDDEDYDRSRRQSRRDGRDGSQPVGGGAAIAPPASLLGDDERVGSQANLSGGLGRGGNVALKIMAKYGFKEGQGLGRQEQGMSQALQVEKTSKRGGKIIHERDMPKEPPASTLFPSPAPPPPNFSQLLTPPPSAQPPAQGGESITEAMKNPSKVVLLRNMVGPGEVDDDLEPEVKEECSKYGEVQKCVIFEVPTNADDEAVRIFVEFKRIESAIKAVVDLNGRYFGGRIVKGGFYNLDKFRRYELAE